MELGRARWIGSALTLAAIAWLGMHEVSTIIGDVAVNGLTHSVSTLYSLGGIGKAGATMHEWATASCAGIPIRSWLTWHLAFDLLFIVGYATAALGVDARFRLDSRWWIGALVIADVVEDGLAGGAIGLLPHGTANPNCTNPVTYRVPVLFVALMCVTLAKWLILILLLIHAAWVAAHRPGAGHGAWLVTKAVGVQRFGALVVAVLAVLLLLPGAPVLEQAIDVERAWVLGRKADLWISAGWAAVAMGLLAAALRYLASIVVAGFEPTQDEQRADGGGPFVRWVRDLAHGLWASRQWLAAVAALTLAIWLLGLTSVVRVYWRSAMWIPIVLGAVPVLSAVFARLPAQSIFHLQNEDVRKKAYQIGRALAWAVPIVLLVSVFRALVAPMMLLPSDRTLCIIVAVIVAAAALGIAFGVLTDNTPKIESHTRSDSWRRNVDPLLVGARGDDAPNWLASIAPSAAVTVAAAGLVLIWPIHVSRFLGVMGMVALSLILLTAFYAMLQIWAQLADPPHLFRLFGLRRAPVVSLVLVIGICSTVFASGGSLHQIRPPSEHVPDARPSLDAALNTWLGAQTPDCALTTTAADGRTLHVRPLVMIAAEGGGIRAAWWTVDVMTSLTSTDCGRKSVFLASGVSGGAVGLGVMATSAHPYQAMRVVAGEDALAAAIDGLLARDLVAGSFGLNVRAADGPSGDPFPDRAAFIEQSWERQSANFDHAFPGPSGSTDVSWRTVFNGTSVAKKCRVMVSDVRLTPTPTTCDDPTNPIPGTYDLLGAEPCDVGLRTSTASLMAARFPYVTPSAVVLDCAKRHTFHDQVIDGGYSENSGMDTVNVLLAQLMPTIRAQNEAALQNKQEATVVVPVVMFLHNSVVASSSGVPKTPKAKAEVIVPPANQSDSSVLMDTSTLLQRSAVIARDWIPDSQTRGQEAQLREALATVLKAPTMTIAPQQKPQFALPLGWTLSRATQKTLDAAYAAYLTCDPKGQRTCTQSVAYDDLLRAWGTQMRFPLE